MSGPPNFWQVPSREWLGLQSLVLLWQVRHPAGWGWESRVRGSPPCRADRSLLQGPFGGAFAAGELIDWYRTSETHTYLFKKKKDGILKASWGRTLGQASANKYTRTRTRAHTHTPQLSVLLSNQRRGPFKGGCHTRHGAALCHPVRPGTFPAWRRGAGPLRALRRRMI